MNVVVVAQHTEDVTWTDDLPPGWTPLVIVKDRDVPNEGREASSWLHAIDTLWKRRVGQMAFVQGDPFDHCEDLNQRLTAAGGGFRWLGPTLTSGPHGEPDHPGLPIGEQYQWITGRVFPGVVRFAAGGQFTAPQRAIKRRPRVFYQGLYRAAMAGDMPWVLERLWEAIITDI